MCSHQKHRGFTLIEMIMVIVILGTVSAVITVFMKSPVDAYFTASRHSTLSDTADTVLRRVGRDVRKSLPNSLRPIGGGSCVEFIPTKTGERYRTQGAGLLDFTVSATSFNMLGSNTSFPANQQIAANDYVVIYNLGNGITGADAYSATNQNKAQVSSVATPTGTPPETTISIAATQFPLASPSNRFQVVSGSEQVVGFACIPAAPTTDASGNGTGVLYRYVSSFPGTASTTCPSSAPSTGTNNVASVSVMANKLSACSFTYSGSDTQRISLLRMSIGITLGGDTANLLQEVHVNNTP